MEVDNSDDLNLNSFEPTTSHGLLYSGSVTNANLHSNAFEPTTLIPQSLYSGSVSKALATLSLGPTKTFFDSEYLTFTSSELQNGQLKPTNFARDMEMPKKCPVFEETIEDKIIQSLVYVELKVRKIRESSCWPCESVRDRSMRELLESNHDNVLAHADQYPKELKWPFTYDEALKLETERRKEGCPNWFILDMFLCIEMVPKNYRMESITDMIKLFSCRTMVPISRLQMTMEEFVLLKAIIYSHSAIHGLSERGRVLLQKESIRYSKTLMKHLQSRMGAAPGAKKYAELASFVGCLFHAAQQLREMHVYIRSAQICSPGHGFPVGPGQGLSIATKIVPNGVGRGKLCPNGAISP
ncbi:ligand-binding domain of nuclear hormone receptor domain-containing protein [Ditylenchus destructor]|nr:ligand-binding domain of nuclear hormone receptor domain-containing protein [Ditylenchus destructor]